MTPCSRHGQARGGIPAPVLIIGGALIISGLVFLFYTRKFIPGNPPPPPAQQAEKSNTDQSIVHGTEPGSAKPSPASGDASTAPLPNPNKPASLTPEAPKQTFATGFMKPSDLGGQVMQNLANGDLAAAARLLASGQTSQEMAAKAVLEQLFHQQGYKPAPPDQLKVLGQVENTMRIAIPLLDDKGQKSDQLQILIDVDRDPKLGWKVSRVHLPKALEAAVTANPANAPATDGNTTAPSAPGQSPLPPVMPPNMKNFVVVDQVPDALIFANEFIRSLLTLNYEKVRHQVNEEKVPAVKLAALCIVFEDGQYVLDEVKPIVATVATDTNSWVISRVHSDLRKEDTEFGVEMELANGAWRVSGLNLSKLLADNTKSSTLVGVPYTPLLQNPKGGESIALYFEYDSDVLHPRAMKQLDVVANILKSAGHKKLKIGGHTDAMGSDTYNMALSQRRAEAVKTYMLSQGVPVEQVQTVGFGKAIPLVPNVNPDGTDNPGGRSRNRRAEILLDF